MGRLVDGKWQATPEKTRIDDRGAFVRGRTKFRHRISRDSSSTFPAEPGRYHLWVAYNCPWAQRTMITRALKKLTDVIGLSIAHFRRNEDGWWYPEGLDDLEPVDGQFALHRLYSMSSDSYSGSATTPVLWDRQEQIIVSNESAEIIVMLNSELDEWGDDSVDLYPAALRSEIDEVNDWVYTHINNGVYKCGFARSQEAYETAFHPLFEHLDRAEALLGRHRFLVGDQITLADIRLFPTLARFDAVYFSHFKCNLRRISDYPNLSNYFRDLYQTPGVSETVKTDIYKKGYYGRSPGLNPRGIIPIGPELSFEAPHDRATRAYGG